MCGRYGRRADKQRIAAAIQAGYTNVFEEMPPSFNVAPQTFQPVVRLSRDSGERELALMRWGLIPWWAKDGKIGFSTINAKAETLSTSPAFREAFQRRRCLVPADWFYEFAFAGLWKSWKDKATGERLYTYTIVTTDPNEVVAPLHNRMPVILSPKDYYRWLAPLDLAHLPVDLLRPFPADMMTAWKVSKAVGNVKNDDPSLIAPI